MKNDTIAEVIALLNTANYDTETLNQKRNEVVSTLKKQLSIQRVSKSFTYKDITKVAEELANDYSSDKKDPVWRDIRQDSIKAIQVFVSKHL